MINWLFISCKPSTVGVLYSVTYLCRSFLCKGFFRSISLRNVNALQDTLRLLTLWFKYGAHDDVSHAMASGFGSVEIDTWLEVIPQVRFTKKLTGWCSLQHNRTDHSTYSDPKCQHSTQYQLAPDGHWAASSAGSNLSAHRRFEIK